MDRFWWVFYDGLVGSSSGSSGGKTSDDKTDKVNKDNDQAPDGALFTSSASAVLVTTIAFTQLLLWVRAEKPNSKTDRSPSF